MKYMTFFSDMLTKKLAEVDGTKYRLSKDSGVQEATVINITNGKRRPTEEHLERFASVKWLSVSLAELKAWKMLDEYSSEEIQVALRLSKEMSKSVGN